MRTASVILATALLATASSKPSKFAREIGVNASPDYYFKYVVRDSLKSLDMGHDERRTGDTTRGEYFVLLPDGRFQTVTYYVDGTSGYVAQVKYSGKAKYDYKTPHKTAFKPKKLLNKIGYKSIEELKVQSQPFTESAYEASEKVPHGLTSETTEPVSKLTGEPYEPADVSSALPVSTHETVYKHHQQHVYKSSYVTSSVPVTTYKPLDYEPVPAFEPVIYGTIFKPVENPYESSYVTTPVPVTTYKPLNYEPVPTYKPLNYRTIYKPAEIPNKPDYETTTFGVPAFKPFSHEPVYKSDHVVSYKPAPEPDPIDTPVNKPFESTYKSELKPTFDLEVDSGPIYRPIFSAGPIYKNNLQKYEPSYKPVEPLPFGPSTEPAQVNKTPNSGSTYRRNKFKPKTTTTPEPLAGTVAPSSEPANEHATTTSEPAYKPKIPFSVTRKTEPPYKFKTEPAPGNQVVKKPVKPDNKPTPAPYKPVVVANKPTVPPLSKQLSKITNQSTSKSTNKVANELATKSWSKSASTSSYDPYKVTRKFLL